MSGPNKRFGLAKGEYMRVCFKKNGELVRGHKAKKGTGEKSK